MAKTISGAMQAHLNSELLSLALCWELTRQDGVTFYFTDHDVDIVFGGNTYVAATGFTRSAIEHNVNLSVDNVEIMGFVDGTIVTVEGIRAGLFDYSEVKTFMVNHEDPDTFSSIKLRRGYLGEVTLDPKNLIFTASVRGLLQNYGKSLLKTFQPECRADLGDTECGVNLAPFTENLTVTEIVTDRQVFKLSAPSVTESEDAGWFDFGVLVFAAGNNSFKAYEIKTWSGSPNYQVELYLPVPYTINVSDAVTITPGCNKIVNGDCFNKFNNVANFRGEPFFPGNDQILLYPDAK